MVRIIPRMLRIEPEETRIIKNSPRIKLCSNAGTRSSYNLKVPIEFAIGRPFVI